MILIVLVTFLLIMYQKCWEKIDSGQSRDLYSLAAKFIMVIELSGVQFGLKSYA